MSLTSYNYIYCILVERLPKTFFIFTTYFVIPFLVTDIKITQTIMSRPKGREDDLAFIRAKRIRISFLALQVERSSL